MRRTIKKARGALNDEIKALPVFPGILTVEDGA
jgi:hypothetical protein